jgi:hypothetical protein
MGKMPRSWLSTGDETRLGIGGLGEQRRGAGVWAE